VRQGSATGERLAGVEIQRRPGVEDEESVEAHRSTGGRWCDNEWAICLIFF
jgi:hypothetical protein